ncbi:MAG: response regulator [Planctomycetes bacterium]|nr:response regulator [Planctomycetota bacterium]
MTSSILIAVGNPLFRDTYASFLRNCGFAVTTAAHGLECLELLQVETPDVLILDWDLPWGGGEGVLAYLREEPIPRKTSVLLSAPSQLWPGLVQGPSLPVASILPRPLGLATLLESVRTAAGTPQPEPPFYPVADRHHWAESFELKSPRLSSDHR